MIEYGSSAKAATPKRPKTVSDEKKYHQKYGLRYLFVTFRPAFLRSVTGGEGR